MQNQSILKNVNVWFAMRLQISNGNFKQDEFYMSYPILFINAIQLSLVFQDDNYEYFEKNSNCKIEDIDNPLLKKRCLQLKSHP